MVPLCNALGALPGQAKVIDGELHLRGLVASPDGQKIFRCERKGKVSGRPRAPGGDGWCQESPGIYHGIYPHGMMINPMVNPWMMMDPWILQYPGSMGLCS